MINNNSEGSLSANSSGARYHQYDCMALACGESGSLNIISELNSLYEDRVNKIEAKTGNADNDPLVCTLKSWVTDLNVQNAELVHALEDLERETACRVKLIEEKMKATSIATRDYMARAQDYNKQMQNAPNGSVQASEDISRIDHLKSDIRNLCRLIQQGIESENWNADEYIFFEVTLEEIFGTYPLQPKSTKPTEITSESQDADALQEDCNCMKEQLQARNQDLESLREALQKLNDEMQQKDAQLTSLSLELSEFHRTREAIGGAMTDKDSMIGSLEDDLKIMKEHMALKDEQIMSLIQKIQELRDDIQEKASTVNTLLHSATEASQIQTEEQRKIEDHQNEILILSRHLKETEFRLDYVLGDKEQLADKLDSVHLELLIKRQEVEALTNAITDMDKCAKDKQAALTGEVADKHDQISLLKRECQQLEDRCRQADMQINFKDGIIKEMRKEIKLSRLKVTPHSETRAKSKSQIPASSSYEDFGQNVATDEMKEDMTRLITMLKARDEKIAQQEILIEDLQKDLDTKQIILTDSSIMNGTKEPEPRPDLKSTVDSLPTDSHMDFSCGDNMRPSKDNSNDCYRGLESSVQQVEEMTWMLEAREEEISKKNAMIVRLRSLLRLAHLKLSKVSKAAPEKRIIASKAKLYDEAAGSQTVSKLDTKPPKMLRAASIEEFRVKTVEAQAAIEDMMEEMETLLSSLNERENRFNELERTIETLQQTLFKNKQEMSKLEDETDNCDREKQVTNIGLEEKAIQILQLKESLGVSFETLMSSPQQTQADQYQIAAKEFQLAVDKIVCELMEIMHAVLSKEKQVVFKQDVIRDVKESLGQIQKHMTQVQTELVSYSKVKQDAEKCRKESERKMEKWQTELENAQDELRDNVEQYAATEYASRGLAQMTKKERPPTRSPLIRNYVYRGNDNDVRRTIEELKEQIDILVDELEEFDDYNEANEQRVKELQDKLDDFQGQVASQKCANMGVREDCNCSDEEVDQGDPMEILQDALETTDCQLEQIQRDIESMLNADSEDDSPAKELLAIIGEHTAIVDELNGRSKNLQEALDKARAQIRTISERNAERRSTNRLPSTQEQQVVLDEYCKKTLQLEEELERSRAQVQSIQGDLKNKEVQLEKQIQNFQCVCSAKEQTGRDVPRKIQPPPDDMQCSCRHDTKPEESLEELKNIVAMQERDLDHLMMENSSLYEELQQKDEMLRKMAIVNHERTILQRELQDELSNTTTLVKMQQHIQNIHLSTRTFEMNVSNKMKAICMKNQNPTKDACQCKTRSGQQEMESDPLRQLEQQIVHLEEQLSTEERLNDENVEKIGELRLTVDSQALELKNWKLSMNKLQKSYDKVMQCAQEKEDAIKLLKQEVCELRCSSNECKCTVLSCKLQQRDQQVGSLQQEVRNLKRRANTCKCTVLKAQLHQKDQELDCVSHQIGQLRGKVSDCRCKSLACQLKAKEEELNRQRQEVNEMRQKLSACRCASKCKAIEQDKMIQAMQGSLKKMEGILKQKDEEFNAAQNQFYEEKCEMERRLCELINSTEEMKSNCNCKKNKAALVEAAEREAALQAKFTEHDGQLRAKIQEMHTLELQLSDEIEALHEQVQNLADNLAQRECELQETAASLQQANCLAERMQAEKSGMETELECGREQVVRLYDSLSKAKVCLIEANNRLEKSDTEIDLLRSLIAQIQNQQNVCTDDKLTNMIQELANLKSDISRLVQLREKTNAEVASLQEAYQYLSYEFNSKSQSVVKLRSILSKVSSNESQSTVLVCSMQKGDFAPQVQDLLGQKDSNSHNEIKKLNRTKELMSNAINKLICDNTNLRRKLRARTMSQNNDWPLLSYPCKALEIHRESTNSTSSISSASSNKEETDVSSTESNNLPDEEVSDHSSYDSCEYMEFSETYTSLRQVISPRTGFSCESVSSSRT